MNKNAKTILSSIQTYLEQNPTIRFTQALFKMSIGDFTPSPNELVSSVLF